MTGAVPVERIALRVRGVVQGVGFRPFVYTLAHELRLSGWVLNDAEGVALEAQGPAQQLRELQRRLRDDAPPLARVDAVEAAPCITIDGDSGFTIHASRAGEQGAGATAIPADAATCRHCLAELFDRADRRHRYAFINCTQCGPRYTITRTLPYDRPSTSMAPFALCPACAREYTDPLDRRFHAEPNACPVCGPRLKLHNAQGQAFDGDPIERTLALLQSGAIVAIKGLGGYHLACDATNANAVAELRRRKAREEKPFALMAASLPALRAWVQIDDTAATLLQAPERPVVLLPMAPGAAAQLPGIAPGLDVLGVMLPCTPIQHLLFHEAAGRPTGLGWHDTPPPLLLVMTSANPGGEPIVIGNDEAHERLQGIADAWLVHDREILARCDDSVLRSVGDAGGAPQFIRRARGWTPRAIKLPRTGPSVLATGAWLKNTVCLTRGDEAFLSPHIGDLDNAATCQALDEAVAHLQRVLDVQPEVVAHDLHPDFYSSRFAAAFAAEHGLPRVGVQHHHAHIAAVVAEHRIDGPVLGLALDGVGLGDDGAAWGGELLRVDGGRHERLAHLRPVALPGGDIAAREPWRIAAAVLHALGRGGEITQRFADEPAAAAVATLLDRGLRCPPTTSLGRWFDAAAALLGVRRHNAYEGQAPMMLEALAARHPALAAEAAELAHIDAQGRLDLLPLLARLADEPDAARGARLFHDALVDALARWTLAAAERTKLTTLALGGGCFLNRLMSVNLNERLAAVGLRILQARAAPPNDGGIALGQAWITMDRWTQTTKTTETTSDVPGLAREGGRPAGG